MSSNTQPKDMYAIVKGTKDSLLKFINDVNSKIKEGYTPLGSPGIEVSGYGVNMYQAFINSPLSASPASPAHSLSNSPSSSSSESSSSPIKKVQSYTMETLTVDGKKYRLDPNKSVYNENKNYIGNFEFAYQHSKEIFDDQNPNFYVNINDFKELSSGSGGSKSTSRKSYKKYTKKSSSRRHKNRK